ncbi:DUF333 domain-containing protein [Stenotrophomonas sp. PS02289]|uniref:putative hemolysin n=1 Tax=Stenotrophomonas sp. PS02289 TaxID=2991422 RepID=UPI00249B0784|nr:DUF333 domain-containing protein [Stenotrophomonas sp. PS02289]
MRKAMNAAVVGMGMVLAGCASTSQPQVTGPAVGMANPASVYCIERGGKSVIETDSAGAQTGFCHLPDGTKTEEWALYRRDHPAR